MHLRVVVLFYFARLSGHSGKHHGSILFRDTQACVDTCVRAVPWLEPVVALRPVLLSAAAFPEVHQPRDSIDGSSMLLI